MSLAGRPSARPKKEESFEQRETRIRSRLMRLSQKRDTEHRLNVREALADRDRMKDYAASRFGGASCATGVRAPSLPDGFYVFAADGVDTQEWRTLVGVNHVLSCLAYADVTSEYTPLDETVGTRLIYVRGGCAVGCLIATDRDNDGEPDGIYHVWVAGRSRRKGIASALVASARERFPISHVIGPLNTQRVASKVAAAIVPDLPVSQ